MLNIFEYPLACLLSRECLLRAFSHLSPHMKRFSYLLFIKFVLWQLSIHTQCILVAPTPCLLLSPSHLHQHPLVLFGPFGCLWVSLPRAWDRAGWAHQDLCSVFIELFPFLLLNCLDCSYTLDLKPFSEVCFADIFPLFRLCLYLCVLCYAETFLLLIACVCSCFCCLCFQGQGQSFAQANVMELPVFF